MQQRTRNPALDHLDALVSAWETEATHPSLPDTVIRGRATFEWLAGGLFLIWRAAYDHPDIPDCIAILGCDDAGSSVDARQASGGCSLHYFDSRGVARVYGLGGAIAGQLDLGAGPAHHVQKGRVTRAMPGAPGTSWA